MAELPDIPPDEFRRRMSAAGFSVRPADEAGLRDGLAALLGLVRHVHAAFGYGDEPAVVFRAREPAGREHGE